MQLGLKIGCNYTRSWYFPRREKRYEMIINCIQAPLTYMEQRVCKAANPRQVSQRPTSEHLHIPMQIRLASSIYQHRSVMT
jgi:hypothetical protein